MIFYREPDIFPRSFSTLSLSKQSQIFFSLFPNPAYKSQLTSQKSLRYDSVSVSVSVPVSVMKTGSYYAILGIRPDASCSEIRSAYRKLAMKWHPDRWARREMPTAAEEAKRRFQQIQEAYQVLSDEGKRALYDAGLYDPFEDEEVVEGFCDFVQEMLDLMANVRKEQGEYSLEELQGMLAEMSQGFDSVPPFSSQYFDSGVNNHSESPKIFQYEENRNLSGFKVLGSRASYC